MASGLTQLRGITDPVWNRLLKGLQKFSGITSTQNFVAPPIPPPVVDYFVLLEDGFYILQEDSSKILIE